MVVDLLFGIAAIALGLYLFLRRHALVAIAQERGRGIKSMSVHNTVAGVLVLVGIWSIAAAFA